jgi:hypothetical protein
MISEDGGIPLDGSGTHASARISSERFGKNADKTNPTQKKLPYGVQALVTMDVVKTKLPSCGIRLIEATGSRELVGAGECSRHRSGLGPGNRLEWLG